MRAGDSRTGFRYFGTDGTELPGGESGADVALVARVRITVLAADPWVNIGGSGIRRESLDVALLRTRDP
jgi:hypothetical protein